MLYESVVAQSMSNFFAPSWTVACQALLSMGFSRPEYWSGQLLPSPGDLPRDQTQVSHIEGGFFTV